MKFTVSQKDLLAKVQEAKAFVAVDNSNEILQNLLFEVKGSWVNIIGQNTDVQIITTLHCSASLDAAISGSKFLVNAKIFTQLVKSLQETVVTIQTTENSDNNSAITVSTENGSFVVPVLDAKLFPKWKRSDRFSSLKISAHQLNTLIKTTGFAAGKKDILSGIHFNVHDHQVTCVATDGHVFAQTSTKVTDNLDISFTCDGRQLVRVKTLFKDQGNVYLHIDSSNVQIRGEGIELDLRTLEGSYPNADQVWKKQEEATSSKEKVEFKINLSKIKPILNRAYVLTNSEMESKNVIVLDTNSKDRTVTLNTLKSASGQLTEELPISDYKGTENKTVALNVKNLISFIKNGYGSETETTLIVSDYNMPVFLKPNNQTDSLNRKQLIMPMVIMHHQK